MRKTPFLLAGVLGASLALSATAEAQILGGGGGLAGGLTGGLSGPGGLTGGLGGSFAGSGAFGARPDLTGPVRDTASRGVGASRAAAGKARGAAAGAAGTGQAAASGAAQGGGALAGPVQQQATSAADQGVGAAGQAILEVEDGAEGGTAGLRDEQCGKRGERAGARLKRRQVNPLLAARQSATLERRDEAGADD